MAVALRTARLLLREWRDDDYKPFAIMSGEPGAMTYLLPFAGRAASDAWIDRMRAHCAQHGFAQMALELAEEQRLIGAIGLLHVRFAAAFAPAVEIGWRLAPAYWGKGYAREGAQAVLDDGFGRLHLDEIVAFTVAANRSSWGLMERLGLRRDAAADFAHPSVPDGHPLKRHILYRLRRVGA
jgi:RimJ/RimL family protein N-acetyltransferase